MNEMNIIKSIDNQTFDEERALYGSCEVHALHCSFDGPADGESAFKESRNIVARDCYFNLRYPFWHNNGLVIDDCKMTENCRAALWYCDHIKISETKMYGIKALRECSDVSIGKCDIISPEFGWSSENVTMENTKAVSEYFMMNAENLDFKRVHFTGKYSFQYVKNAVFDDCIFDTKDAFWHSKNVTVRNSTVKGEYLAWYSEGLTLENCKIIGTQPFCYCKNLRLINCEMINADLCFEKSDVSAELIAPVISIKNPTSGMISVPAVDEIIMDDPAANAKIIIAGNTSQRKIS